MDTNKANATLSSNATSTLTLNTALKNGQALPIYHGIFIAAQVFQVFLITDAVTAFRSIFKFP